MTSKISKPKIILFALAILCFVLMASAPASAQAAKTVVIFPLAFYGDPSKAYLREGLRSMLLSRLSGGDIRILGDATYQERLTERERQGLLTRARAEELARIINADYVLYGSITTVGPGYSIDLTLLELKEGGTRTSNIAEALDEKELIEKMGDIAYQFRGFVEGRDIRAERLARAYGPVVGGEEGGLFGTRTPVRRTPDLKLAGRLSLKIPVMAFDAGDLDGDGTEEWAVIGRGRFLVYKQQGKTVTPVGLLKPSKGEQFLSVSVGDGDGNGKAEIYIVGRYGSRARTTVWEWSDKFKKLYNYSGQVRAVKYPWSNETLLLHMASGVNEFLTGRLAIMTYDGKGKPVRKDELKRLKKVQFYTLTPYDFDGDGKLEFLCLDSDNSRPKILSREGKVLWRGDKSLGGSNNIIYADVQSSRDELDTRQVRFNSRLVIADIDRDGNREVLAIDNVPISEYMQEGIYTKGRLTSFRIQGVRLIPAWTTREMKHAISDIQMRGRTLFLAVQSVKLVSLSQGTGAIMWFK